MAINGLSVGRDIKIDIHTSKGSFQISSEITSFEISPTPEMRRSVMIDGTVRDIVLPQGFSGSMEIDRINDDIESYWAQYEKDYYDGKNLQPATITATKTEPNGSISQWIATGVVFAVEQFGAWSGSDFVKQRISFKASRYEQQI